MGTMRRITAPIEKKHARKVAAYARISMETERSPKSLSLQISYYSDLIQSTPGWEYAGVFYDSGISGTTTRRAGFQEMLQKSRTGHIDLILTKSISRFARNTVDLLTTCRELKRIGVEVRFEKENISTFSADGELMLTLLASFAQAESEQNSQNVKWAIRRNYARGNTNSHWIYGYDWDGYRFTINESEAKIVKEVFDAYLAGISPEAMACRLNQQGIRSRGGGRFYGSVLRRWLENERYAGNQMMQKTYTTRIGSSLQARNTGELPKYWVEHCLPAIIPADTFNAVQAEIARRREVGWARTPGGRFGPLTHLIHCSECGKHYHRRTKRKKSGSTYKYWWCETATKGNGNPCKAKQLREETIMRIISTVFGKEKLDSEDIITGIDHIDAYPSGQLHIVLTDSILIPVDYIKIRKEC